jgi:hypothetical protein
LCFKVFISSQPEGFGEVMDLDTDSFERGTNERNFPRTLKEDGDTHANQISKKRTLEEEGTEDETKKKRKEGTTFEIMDMEEFNLTAGLQERLRRDQ